ncbi:response regulator [Candidatus Margulisiibacteriota bacterium]
MCILNRKIILELEKQLSSKPGINKDAYFIGITAITDNNQPFKDAGANVVLNKPVTRAQFLTELDKALDQVKLSKENVRILLVDDDPILRMLYEDILQAGGYKNLLIAENPVQAIELLKEEEQFRPDIVITDFNMPEMNGDEFVKNSCAGEYVDLSRRPPRSVPKRAGFTQSGAHGPAEIRI